jgi:hypothetical protein
MNNSRPEEPLFQGQNSETIPGFTYSNSTPANQNSPENPRADEPLKILCDEELPATLPTNETAEDPDYLGVTPLPNNPPIADVVASATALPAPLSGTFGSRGNRKKLPSLVEQIPEAQQDFAISSGFDPDLVALIMLLAASCAAQKGYVLEIDKGELHQYPNIYSVAGAPPSYGKTLSQQLVFEPVYSLERQLVAEQKKKRVEILAEIKRESWKRSKLTKTGREEEENKETSKQVAQCEIRIQELSRSLMWLGKFLYSDASAAGLKREISVSPNEYLSLVASDGRHIAKNLPRPGSALNSLGQTLIEWYSGDALGTTRGSGARQEAIAVPLMTTFLLLQEDIGTRLLNDHEAGDAGLTARLIPFFFSGHRGAPKPVSDDAKAAWGAVIRRIHAGQGIGEPKIVTPDSDGRAALREFISAYRIKQTANETPQRMKAWWGRATEHVQRVALLIALMHSDGGSGSVTKAIAEAANSVVEIAASNLENCLKMGSDYFAESSEAAKLRRELQREGGSILMPELNKFGLVDRTVRRLAQELPGVFSIRNVASGKKGRPRKEVILVKPERAPEHAKESGSAIA